MSDVRYPAVVWPWVGVFLCLALVGQEYLLQAAGPNPPLTLYRIVVMIVGVTSASADPAAAAPRRLFARICRLRGSHRLRTVSSIRRGPGAVSAMRLSARLRHRHGTRISDRRDSKPGTSRRERVCARSTAYRRRGSSVSPRGRSGCNRSPRTRSLRAGWGLSYMLDTLPFTDVFRKVLEGSGECAEKGWEFLHLSIAGWTLVFFVAMIAASFALIRRDT